MIADFLMDARPPSVPEIIAAFVWPLAIHLEEGNHYLAFMSRYITEEGGYGGLEGASAGASVMTLRSLFGRLTSDFPPEVVEERWWVTLTSAVHALARYQSAQRRPGGLPAPLDVLLADLVAFLSAGVVAPLADETLRRPVVLLAPVQT